MAKKRAVGEGSISRRKDGRYEVAITCLTTAGTRKRVRKYATTRAEADEILTALKRKAQQGLPVPDKSWKLGQYLDYWIREVVLPTRRPATYERYEIATRLYLKPALGGYTLTQLTVPIVQSFLNKQLTEGRSLRNVQIIREVLSSALTRAMREELLARNVARLVELPKWEQKDIVPWTCDEAQRFLIGASGDALYPAFLLLSLCGLRRGEVLGLRWSDIDFEASTIRVRQQVQRVAGALRVGPVKTKAGKRTLPMLSVVRTALLACQARQVHARTVAPVWYGFAGNEALAFTSRTGNPIEPRNLVRSFQLICNRCGIRIIRVHDLRHTTATLLKDLGVPVRDAQLILGHSTVSITQEIYQHDRLEGRREALQRVEELLMRPGGAANSLKCNGTSSYSCRQGAQSSRQIEPSRTKNDVDVTSYISVIPGRGSRTRTYDTRFWSTNDSEVKQGWAESRAFLQHRTRIVLLGLVAVKSGRQSLAFSLRVVQGAKLTTAATLHANRCAPSLRTGRDPTMGNSDEPASTADSQV